VSLGRPLTFLYVCRLVTSGEPMKVFFTFFFWITVAHCPAQVIEAERYLVKVVTPAYT